MIVTADSVTQLGDVAGQVVVAGSHGGLVAAHYAAAAGVRALILNDAGVGLDEAGVAGLKLLETIGMACAAVGHATARIGDGADMLARGVVSRVNGPARALGVSAGMRSSDAALLLTRASMPFGTLPEYVEGRYDFAPRVRGLDSIGMTQADDAGLVLIIGSHAALHGGRAESALPVDAAFAIFNDAGGAVSRLGALEHRRIAAAAVDCMSARIGDARSMWERGILSHVNESARAAGVARGMSVRTAVEAVGAPQKMR